MQAPTRVMLPLSELFLSHDNMRKAKTSKKSDSELRASIQANHIIQNLVVSQKTEQGYPVEAGGRRYIQCLKLVENGHFTIDEKVPVMILAEGQSAKDVSLVENFMRERAHPVDEYEAFLYLHENDGFSIATIASRYGQTKKYIKQRLLLAGVAPELREHCRRGKFDLDILEAFTVSDDHDKQLEAYSAFKNDEYQFSNNNIRVYLTDKALTSKNKLVKFVGLAAFKKAGGSTMDDMFGDVVYINDNDLFNTLLDAKMDDVKDKLLTQWAWVEVDYKLQNWQVNQYPVIAKELVKPPKKLVTTIDAKKARLEELDSVISEEWTDKLDEEYEAIGVEIDELDVKLAPYNLFVKDEFLFGGCLITLDDDGAVVIHEGLVRDDDIAGLMAHRAPQSVGDTATCTTDCNNTSDKEPLYNQALKQDLSIYRKSIAKIAIAKNTNLGSDLAIFSLCYPVFKTSFGNYPLSIQVRDTAEETSKGDIVNSKAQKELDETFLTLDRSWVSDCGLASLKAFRALPSKEKKALCAYCSAYALCGFSLGQDDGELAKYIFEESKVEPTEYYRPTSSNFFKRIKEPHFTKLATEILGADWLAENNLKKRAYIAERMEWAVSGNAPVGTPLTHDALLKWMPNGF
jgi:ParB family chromosome partitioning protein